MKRCKIEIGNGLICAKQNPCPNHYGIVVPMELLKTLKDIAHFAGYIDTEDKVDYLIKESL
jgi:hypothetical protein